MLIVVAVLKVKLYPQEKELPFQPVEVLFTPAERSFLGVLEQALDSSCRVGGHQTLGGDSVLLLRSAPQLRGVV